MVDNNDLEDLADTNYDDNDDVIDDLDGSDGDCSDDEIEEDTDDSEDIADKTAADNSAVRMRNMDDYELMADAAALQGIDMVEPSNPPTSLTTCQVLNKGKGSGKGRTATKGLKTTEPMFLEFDKYDRPTGKWQEKYGQHIGFCMRKLNINWNWKDVSVGKKKLMWEDTMNLFHIPDEERLRKNFLSAVAKRFRDFKSKLVSGWITKTRTRSKSEDGREPHEIWKHIKVEDWKLFEQIKNSSPAKRKREKAIECAKKNEHHHHLGQNSFNAARTTWIKDGFYPGSSPVAQTSTVTTDANRADDWFCSMHCKDKESGKYLIKQPKTKEVAEKYLEIRGKQISGEVVFEQNKDALYYALGEKDDHPSRARGFGGVNVTVKRAFGGAACKSSRSRKKVATLEDREALKNELREELKNEMKLALRNNVSSILEEMGLSTLKQPDDSANYCVRIRLGHQDYAETNNLKPPPTLKIKNDTPLRLHLKDPHNGVLYEVARGKAFPGEVCHQDAVASNLLRVKVSVVPQEFETLPLPIPVSPYDLYVLKDAVGSIVKWPIILVQIDSEVEHEDAQNEVMGSNSHHTRLSVTPKKACAQDFIVDSLTPDCQWLNTFVGMMADGETCNIYFDADLFYYDKDEKTEIHKEDLQQFLKGKSELCIPIIQVFMRALRDDLLEASTKPRIGWLCPDATLDTKLIKKAEVAIAYLTSAFQSSSRNGHEFILAPILDSKHWLLLVICPQTYTIYEFDSIARKQGRKLYMKMIVLRSLKRYKMAGGKIQVRRNEPLWKLMKCPQQSNDLEYGYFVMCFMLDIVKNCATVSDLEKVWNSHEAYTECKINEVRDKWAAYFTSHCVN